MNKKLLLLWIMVSILAISGLFYFRVQNLIVQLHKIALLTCSVTGFVFATIGIIRVGNKNKNMSVSLFLVLLGFSFMFLTYIFVVALYIFSYFAYDTIFLVLGKLHLMEYGYYGYRASLFYGKFFIFNSTLTLLSGLFF